MGAGDGWYGATTPSSVAVECDEGRAPVRAVVAVDAAERSPLRSCVRSAKVAAFAVPALMLIGTYRSGAARGRLNNHLRQHGAATALDNGNQGAFGIGDDGHDDGMPGTIDPAGALAAAVNGSRQSDNSSDVRAPSLNRNWEVYKHATAVTMGSAHDTFNFVTKYICPSMGDPTDLGCGGLKVGCTVKCASCTTETMQLHWVESAALDHHSGQ